MTQNNFSLDMNFANSAAVTNSMNSKDSLTPGQVNTTPRTYQDLTEMPGGMSIAPAHLYNLMAKKGEQKKKIKKSY